MARWVMHRVVCPRCSTVQQRHVRAPGATYRHCGTCGCGFVVRWNNGRVISEELHRKVTTQ